MNVRGRDEQVNPPPRGIPGRPDSSVDVPFDRTGKAADFHALHLAGNRLDCGKIPRARNREARLQHIHAQLGQLISEYDLLFRRQARSGSLLTVTQRCIKNLNPFFYRYNHEKPS
ncbi:hypothetical protein D3C73_1120920 [compost metagenome]